MIELKPLSPINAAHYSFMERLLAASFPLEEYRNLTQLRHYAIHQKNFHIVIALVDKQPIGFVSYWELSRFYYIEHFAVDRNCRNQGYGEAIIRQFIEHLQRPVVLEVELPDTEMAQRRIAFYQRNNFVLWNETYLQPPYRKGNHPLPMRLMAHGALNCKDDYKEIVEEIYRQVYGMKPLFLFHHDRLCLQVKHQADGIVTYCIPYDGMTGDYLPENKRQEITSPEGKPVVTASVEATFPADPQWKWVGLRESYAYLTPEEYAAAGKAYQLCYWDAHSRFCPVCGTPTLQETVNMKKCPQCGYELYPPIATAVIVLIRRKEEVLLVRSRHFRGTHYGLVAGFLEVGETLEQCVQREVMEETGLRIRNITYYDSQPWPYPCGLMVGFTADYQSGSIKLQEDELTAAAFFTKETLPELPSKLSIARRLIDEWLQRE
jgi:NAD+ diphosphatase